MEMGQFFREWLAGEGFIAKDAVPEAETVRFYANSIQRTRATARAFAAGMFPMADIDVEQHTPLGTMDPVFNPQITKLSEGFLAKAYAEIEDMGGTDGPLKQKYALLEKVLDIKASPAAKNDTTSFGQFPSSVRFEVGKEPMMSGGLKMACSASDALTLQYYEEPDALKAGFGHALSRQDWADLSGVKDWYQDLLFAIPSVAVNVAHPILQELLAELRASGRRFAFLCGHDSNIGSVLAALGAEPYSAPAAIETKTPIGGKILFQKYRGRDGKLYADLWLVYASVDQLREVSLLSPSAPPMALRLALRGLTANADGLYPLEALEQRFTEAIDAYNQL
jgi:glucose-1-phosphatase